MFAQYSRFRQVSPPTLEAEEFTSLSELYNIIVEDNHSTSMHSFTSDELTPYAAQLLENSTVLLPQGQLPPSIRTIINILQKFGYGGDLFDPNDEENAMSGLALMQSKQAVEKFASIYNSSQLVFNQATEHNIIHDLQQKINYRLYFLRRDKSAINLGRDIFYYEQVAAALGSTNTFYGSNRELSDTNIEAYGLRFVVALFWKAANEPIFPNSAQDLDHKHILDCFVISIIKGLRGKNINNDDGVDDISQANNTECGAGCLESFIAGMATIFPTITFLYSAQEFSDDMLRFAIRDFLLQRLHSICQNYESYYSASEIIDFWNQGVGESPDGFDIFQDDIDEQIQDIEDLMDNVVCPFIEHKLPDYGLDIKLELLQTIHKKVTAHAFDLHTYVTYTNLPSAPNSNVSHNDFPASRTPSPAISI